MLRPEAGIKIQWHNGSPSNFEGSFAYILLVDRHTFGDSPMTVSDLTSRVSQNNTSGASPEDLKKMARGIDIFEHLAKQGGEIVLHACGPNERGCQILIPEVEGYDKA